MTELGFQQILQFIEKETGIALPDTNYRNVKKYLEEKLQEHQLDAGGYLGLLGRDQAEYDLFINTITINETYFFREEKHFSILDQRIIPELCLRKPVTLNIWSAACSSGEEAVSLLAILHKHKTRLASQKFSLYATDINPFAVAKLKKGEYSKNSFRQDGRALHNLLDPLGSNRGETWLLKEEFRKTIQSRPLNLFSPQYPLLPSVFQVIFLRNTLLYMKIETRLKIIDQLSRLLEEGGYLFLAMAETALINHPDLRLQEQDKIYFFQKKTAPPAPEGIKPLTRTSRVTLKEVFVPGKTPPPAADTSPLEEILSLLHPGPEVRPPDQSSKQLQIAQLLKESVRLINTGAHTTAGETIVRLKSLTRCNEVIDYLEGCLDMSSGRPESAIEHFSQAITANNSFWLARFHLAKLISKDSPPRAKREFLICRTHIERYIQTNSSSYQFLLEGFNAGYFQSICSSWIENYNRKEKA